VPAGGWSSAPGCIDQHAAPSVGIYKPYEKCADFFTFGHGSKIGTLTDGVNSSYWVLVALGFSVMVAFLIGWVVLEDRKLRAQAAYLLEQGVIARGGEAAPAAGVVRGE
jgi:hypothetical protein